MAAEPSYSFSAVVRIGARVTGVRGEFQAPDGLHEQITAPDGRRAEVIMAGGRTFVRNVAGRWAVVPTTGVTGAADPRATFGVLTGVREVTGSDGIYRFELLAAAASRLLSGAASTSGGVGVATLSGMSIRRLDFVLGAAQQRVELEIDYSDLGSAPRVTAPPAAPG